MSSEKIVKTPARQLKVLKRWKRFVTVLEVIFAAVLILCAVVIYVPNVKAAVIEAMSTTSFGQQIISWIGSNAYAESVFDSDFDNEKLQTNELEYNYSEEYTNFVLYGVDSRNGEVDTSNSDSIMIVSIHNTTGEVKLVSVYRDTLLGIYDSDGNLTNYFKVNSAYSYGGAEGAINTLNKNLDLDIMDYVTVNFSGVAEIIDALGGIRVNLTDDEVAQLNQHLKSTISSTGEYASPITSSGENIKLNGIQATTYCRIRKATFYDPDTGEAISNDFGRTARQQLVITKLLQKAKKASFTELKDMVETVLNDNTDDDQIISTSFSLDEILNLLPVVFDFKIAGSQGFPSELTTATIDGASYVIPMGLSANVSALHEFLYGEKDYQPTSDVQSVNDYVVNYTGISEYSSGGYSTTTSTDTDEDDTYEEETMVDDTDYDYDDKGKSKYY